MQQTLSENLSTRLETALLGMALSKVPKLNAANIRICLTGGSPINLTAKQTNLTVAHLNRELRAHGFSVITAKELVGGDVKPTYNGCLDPCKGTSTDRLVDLLSSRLGSRSAGVR